MMGSCRFLPIKLAANPGGPFRRYPQRTERCVPTGVIGGFEVRTGSSGGASHKMGDHRGKLSSLKISVNRVVSKFRSALNGHLPQFLALLADQSVSRIIVEHRGRFAPFFVECLEAALAAQGRELVVEAPSELDDNQVRDMAEIQTNLSSQFLSLDLW